MLSLSHGRIYALNLVSKAVPSHLIFPVNICSVNVCVCVAEECVCVCVTEYNWLPQEVTIFSSFCKIHNFAEVVGQQQTRPAARLLEVSTNQLALFSTNEARYEDRQVTHTHTQTDRLSSLLKSNKERG